MNLASRLRQVVRPGAPRESPRVPSGSHVPVSGDAADVLGGEWHESGGQRFLVIDRKYPPGHRHGRVAVADALPPADGWPTLALLGARGSKLLFMDLETTGLAGGAGTCAFLVGCAWFEGATFRVRQFFLPGYAAERALLQTIAAAAGSAETLVTYNGKTFDVPLIETRFLFHRLPVLFGDLAHVDVLHSARRLWRADDSDAGLHGSCRLMALERTLLGHDREGDVPGFEIPSRYFHYVRTGDAAPLMAVVEHNRLDLLALAMMTARAAHLLDAGAPAATTAREAIGLGRIYERAGRNEDAHRCYTRATEMVSDAGGTHAEAWRALALLHHRERRYDEAAEAWRRLLGIGCCPPQHAREATEALAVHHEHRIRDLTTARRFALQSLALRETAAIQHRLARLDRKIVKSEAPRPGGLFAPA